jgi:hypothetical protein
MRVAETPRVPGACLLAPPSLDRPRSRTDRLRQRHGRPVVVDDRTLAEESRSGHIHRAEVTRSRIFQQQRAGKAVAELGGIGPQVLARRTGVTRDAHVVIAVGAAIGDEVEERLRATHGEAGELDERAVPERGEGSCRRRCCPASGWRRRRLGQRAAGAAMVLVPCGIVQKNDGRGVLTCAASASFSE